MQRYDFKTFKEQLSAADRASFDTWYETQDKDAIDGLIVLPRATIQLHRL